MTYLNNKDAKNYTTNLHSLHTADGMHDRRLFWVPATTAAEQSFAMSSNRKRAPNDGIGRG